MLDLIQKQFAEKIISSHAQCGDETVSVEPQIISALSRFLKQDHGFDLLMDLTVVDYIKETPRFEVVYHFFSTKDFRRLRVKSRVSETKPEIASLYHLYKSANFMEREAFDMYGVIFKGHPNLKRILLYPEFKGFPLRKDYQTAGEQPLVAYLQNVRTNDD
jgi:NADH-quinone oxidoreductase subunit C